MSVLDTFTFILKPDDKGVEAKLDKIDTKAKAVNRSTDNISKGYGELGTQLAGALNKAIPGSDRLLSNLGKIGQAIRTINVSSGGSNASRLVLGGIPAGGASGGGATPPPIPRPGVAANAAGGAGAAGSAAAGLSGVAIAAVGAAAALAVVTVAAATLTKAFFNGVKLLSESRKAATEAGVTNTQMAAVEQFAKSMRLDRADAQNALKEIAKTTQAGWVKARERGNIFGIGNEQTQLLRKNGIRTSDSDGNLRNSAAIFDDIGKKMKTMSRDSAIAFGEFFGMTKDFAAGVYDSKQSLTEFANANKESIATQAQAMVEVKKYEQAQKALSNAWDDFSIKVGGKVLPVLTTLLNVLVDDIIPEVERFGKAVYGQMLMIGDIAETIFNLISNLRKRAVDFVFGEGAADKLSSNSPLAAVTSTVADTYKKYLDYMGTYGRDETDQGEFDREMKKNTSLNASAAKVQLEAANLMKTATAKFGLSMEQYLAMWAATSGKASGLRDSGGLTTAGFRDAYRDVTSQYATPEVAVAMYGRGQPMMQQLPQQYAMGLGVTPQGIPGNARGLDRAKEAVRDTSGLIGPGASPFGGKRGGRGKTIEQVTIGDIHINTRSTDPQAINDAVTGSLVDNMKFALNKLNDGQVA